MDKAVDTQTVVLLSNGQFQANWKEIEERLDADPSLWELNFTKEELVDLVLRGAVQVWVVDDINGPIKTVFMTEIIQSPNVRRLRICWLWGEDVEKSLEVMSSTIDKVAALGGCERIEVSGRKGWGKWLEPLGARYVCTTWQRPVGKLKEH